MSYNPYRKYCLSWWRYWLNLPGDVYDFCVKLYDYAPLLWEDRDWDFGSVMRVMRFKLKRIRGHIEGHAIICHAEDYVAELAKADVLLRNVVDEDPDNEWNQHYYQWDQQIRGFKDCKNQREHKRALKLSWLREKRNWRVLWRYIEKHAQSWSD